MIALASIRGISLEGPMDEFCHTLDRQLDRPVVNETNLQSEYAFDRPVKARTTIFSNAFAIASISTSPRRNGEFKSESLSLADSRPQMDADQHLSVFNCG